MKLRMSLVIRVLLVATMFQIGNVAALPPQKPATAPLPQWLWLSDRPRDNQTVYFRKAFTVRGKIKVAQLATTCDNRLTVHLNGEKVVTNDAWETPAIADVTT